MSDKILIDAARKLETRLAIVKDKNLENIDFEFENNLNLRGNIYLAKVTRIEPSLQAAFVDYGGKRHGFLAFSDIHSDYYQVPVSDRNQIKDLISDEDALLEEISELNHELSSLENQKKLEYKKNKQAYFNQRDKLANAEENNFENIENIDDDDFDTTEIGGENNFDNGSERFENDIEDEFDESENELTPIREKLISSIINRRITDNQYGDQILLVNFQYDSVFSHAGSAQHNLSIDSNSNIEIFNDNFLYQKLTSFKKKTKLFSKKKKNNKLNLNISFSNIVKENEFNHYADAEKISEALSFPKKNQEHEIVQTLKSYFYKNKTYFSYIFPNWERQISIDPKGVIDPFSLKNRSLISKITKLKNNLQKIRGKRINIQRQYKIQEVIKKNQIVLVQIVKNERGVKGASLTTFISIAGKYCVLMPNNNRGGGVSRKISNESERKSLKSILNSLVLAKGMGLIIRTAGAKKTKKDIKNDFQYLIKLWEKIRSETLVSTAPSLIYEEADLIKKAIRDYYNRQIDEIIIEGEDAFKKAKRFMRLMFPSHVKKIKIHKSDVPIFSYYKIEQEIDKIYNSKVTLPSGGYIIINHTEALVAIDVNSGKATSERNIEKTAVATNLEAATEIARQCKLRDLAGLIVIDFIDMIDYKNERLVERHFKEALSTDNARLQISRISSLGLIEMSRQRKQNAIGEISTRQCSQCSGLGLTRSIESAASRILRAVEAEIVDKKISQLKIFVSKETASHIINVNFDWYNDIKNKHDVDIEIVIDDSKFLDQFHIHSIYEKQNNKANQQNKKNDAELSSNNGRNNNHKNPKRDTKNNPPKKFDDKNNNDKKNYQVKKDDETKDDSKDDSDVNSLDKEEKKKNNSKKRAKTARNNKNPKDLENKAKNDTGNDNKKNMDEAINDTKNVTKTATKVTSKNIVKDAKENNASNETKDLAKQEAKKENNNINDDSKNNSEILTKKNSQSNEMKIEEEQNPKPKEKTNGNSNGKLTKKKEEITEKSKKVPNVKVEKKTGWWSKTLGNK